MTASAHLATFRHALAKGLTLEEARRQLAKAEDDRRVKRLKLKGWQP